MMFVNKFIAAAVVLASTVAFAAPLLPQSTIDQLTKSAGNGVVFPSGGTRAVAVGWSAPYRCKAGLYTSKGGIFTVAANNTDGSIIFAAFNRPLQTSGQGAVAEACKSANGYQVHYTDTSGTWDAILVP